MAFPSEAQPSQDRATRLKMLSAGEESLPDYQLGTDWDGELTAWDNGLTRWDQDL